MKNKLIKKIPFLMILSILSTFKMQGQQDPQYTQYMYNMNIVNPAYAGSKGTMSIGLLGRKQWVGIDGAPETFTATINAPLGMKTGIGLSVISDKIGPVKETNAYADYSYTIETSEIGRLAFGIKAGATFQNINFLSLEAIDHLDPLILENLNNTYPNFGAGAYYYTNKFYVGFSVPNILQSRHFEKSNGLITKASEKMHFFATTGYVFEVTDRTKFKPSVMVKGVTGAPLSIDLSANILFNDRLELGASYRLDDSVSGMIGIYMSPKFRIGYAYDYTLSNLGNFNSGSHEIIIGFDISKVISDIKSPRFF